DNAPENFISLVPDGIHVLGKSAMRQEAGGSVTEMGSSGIDSRAAAIWLNCGPPAPTPAAAPGGPGPAVGPSGPAWSAEGQGANPVPQAAAGGGAKPTSWQAKGDAWAGKQGSGPNTAKVLGAEGQVTATNG